MSTPNILGTNFSFCVITTSTIWKYIALSGLIKISSLSFWEFFRVITASPFSSLLKNSIEIFGYFTLYHPQSAKWSLSIVIIAGALESFLLLEWINNSATYIPLFTESIEG